MSVKNWGTILAVIAMAGGVSLVAMRGAAGHAPGLHSPRGSAIPASAAASRMPVATLLPLVAAGRALVVDVRIERSFDLGHVDGAINVPVDEIGSRSSELIRLAAGRPIVTYCSCVNEHTSAVAALELAANGAANVSALLGGYPAWVAQGGAVQANR